jgi:hypothetical protein
VLFIGFGFPTPHFCGLYSYFNVCCKIHNLQAYSKNEIAKVLKVLL